jgi:GntR family transcriptional regulator
VIRGVNLKHERIASVLAREIRSGRVQQGAQLPGEVELAKRFSVSRNTVRAALAALSEDGLITTRTGKGSFVLSDGRPLDERLGWTQALAQQGVKTQTRVIRLAVEEDHDLAERLELDSPQVVVIERLRTIVGGDAISIERSCVPAVEELRDLPERGLENDSITATLSRAGLHLDHCEQWLRGRQLDESEAKLLGRRPGEWFLHTRRVSWTADDRFAEQVESLLDPKHFELSLTYGEAGR